MAKKVRAYKVSVEGKPAIVFLELNELGMLAFNDTGIVRGWSFLAEPNVTLSMLSAQNLQEVKNLQELRECIVIGSGD